MNNPSYAGLNIQLGEIQFLRDIAVVQPLTHCAINRAQGARSFPKAFHLFPFPSSPPWRAVMRTTGVSFQTWSFVHLDLTNLRGLTPEAEAYVSLDLFR